MYYTVKYQLDGINRDLQLEELIENVNQHILKKYMLANAIKQIEGPNYLVRIDNITEPKLVLYNKFYSRLEDNL